ncbi:SEFIR domain-containing protein [Pedobacter mucosus]|uniref:SEFIR domain-containing protein n=1 Tax=Pedobacter mucosus TaxID=2895286 RepID=UPI001EE3B099|nr:SEFIR domain-containing protein [Pedobacter mucosus]UKT65096.1 TIR domain-containing protein [Pedobacter mucosus]
MSVINVFISYAWESEKLKKEVTDLAQWITTNANGKVLVTTDHLFAHRPPKMGWPTWMADQIESSEVVLIVCTPAYLSRFRKKEELGKGRGVIYEGGIITQELINNQTINEKFFPIVPDDGDIENIPVILQQYFNGHFFPSGNEGILKMILNDNPTFDHVRQFFEASSVGEAVKESIANDIQEKINTEIAKEILSQFTFTLQKKETNMLSPIQNTIRAYLSLNDFDKLKIINSIGIDIGALNHENIIERDKEVFKLVKEQELIASLWNCINEIKSFGNLKNPFIK